MGSNITVERLRFIFRILSASATSNSPRWKTGQRADPVRPAGHTELMTLDQALESGALAFFGEK